MWRAKSDQPVLHVAIGVTSLDWGIVRPGVRTPDFATSVQLANNLPDTLAAACDVLCAASAQALSQGVSVTSMQVLVADSWLAVTQLPWSDELRRDASKALYARQQLASAGFEVQSDDVVRVGDAPVGEPRLVVAYPATLLALIRRLADAWQAEIETLLPLSVAAWNISRQQRARDDNGAPVLVWSPGCLMVLQGDRRMTDVTVRGAAFGFDGVADARQAVATQWQRMCFRTPMLERVTHVKGVRLWPSEVTWPDLSVVVEDVSLPVASAAPTLQLFGPRPVDLSELDAIAAKSRAGTSLQKAMVACLLAFSIAVGLKAIDHVRVATKAEQLLAEHARRTITAEDKRNDGRFESPARISAVNTAIQELNVPVADLMDALRAPRDIGVWLLSVDMSTVGYSSSGSTVMKVVGEARSTPDMTRYVAHISGHPPIRIAYLTRHEVQPSSPDRPYRFMVEAQWAH